METPGIAKREAHAAWLVGGFPLRAGERGYEFVPRPLTPKRSATATIDID